MKNTVIAAAALLLLAACKQQHKETDPPEIPLNITNAAWLLGTWKNNADGEDYTETWKKVNDSVFHGEAFVLKNNDTTFHETVVLAEANGSMGFTVTAHGQNDEQPIRFEMTSITQKEMIFENPKHDFPTKIIYTQVTPDSLVAVISGRQNGKEASVPFPMKKVK